MRRPVAVLGLCAVAWAGLARAADVPPADAPPPAIPAASGSAASAPAAPGAPTPLPAAPVAPPPGADQIQFAAREHDLGYRAYLDKAYDEAASHFENAFFAAPNPAELRSAVRARLAAAQPARAATLAAIGLRRFPTDAATAKVAADVIAQVRPHVFEVQISSPDDYSVAVDERIVAVERVKASRIFVTPGPHELLVSWSEDRNTRVAIDAREGGTQTLELAPPALPAPAPTVAAVVTPPPPSVLPPAPPAVPPPAPKPLGPAVFITGAAITAVGVAVTTWSGIDTLNNPGRDAVRAKCAGQPTSCQAYQQGLASQLRTNVLLAVTGALALTTAVVGVFFTQWSSDDAARPAAHARVPAPALTPVVGIGQAGIEGTF
jgi:hypothetical protein